MGDPALIAALSRDYSPRKSHLKIILVLVALAAGVVAAMNPRVPGKGDAVNRKGMDLVFALDVSKSMLATDLAPSRLERARQFIIKMMQSMPDDRVALVLFAGKSYLQMPLTADLGAAALYVSAAGPDLVPQQGTLISEALNMSASVFNPQEKRYKAVVLISDGEDHEENAITTAKELSRKAVMINTVGIGSPEGSTIPEPGTGVPKTDENGNTVISKLNEPELQSIAAETQGIYIRLQGTEDAVKLLKAQLAKIDRKSYTDESLMDFRSFYPWLAAAMLVLLLFEFVLPETRLQAA